MVCRVAPASDARRRLATRPRAALSPAALLVFARVVAVLDGLGLGWIAAGQVARVGVQLDLAHLRLAEPPADAVIGHRVLLPIRDAALLGQVAQPPPVILDAATGLH